LRVDAFALFVRGYATDARRLAESLGSDFREISIEPLFEAYMGALREQFAGKPADLTEENLQARIRSTLLMALSNKFGWLVVATGNKSELSVGYSTLYGDLAGGFALIKDVFKTDVFRLARHLNERAGRELIPESIIERAPSAELRPHQLDEDSLPPYSELDRSRGIVSWTARGRSFRATASTQTRRASGGVDRSRRVQTAPGASRRASAPEGLRARSPDADHQPLARLDTNVHGCRRRAMFEELTQALGQSARHELFAGCLELRKRPPADVVHVLGGEVDRRSGLVVGHTHEMDPLALPVDPAEPGERVVARPDLGPELELE
jgi:hypothetical protein